jgi:hypothetical protein
MNQRFHYLSARLAVRTATYSIALYTLEPGHIITACCSSADEQRRSVPAAGTELAVKAKCRQGCCRAAQLRHNDAIFPPRHRSTAAKSSHTCHLSIFPSSHLFLLARGQRGFLLRHWSAASLMQEQQTTH